MCIQMSASFFSIWAAYSFTPVPKYDAEPELRYEYECLLNLEYKTDFTSVFCLGLDIRNSLL